MDQQTPPHAPEAERALVATLLLRADRVLPDVTGLLTPDDWYLADCREVYRAIVDLDEAGESIETTAVAVRLRSTGRLDVVGGMPALARMLDTPDLGSPTKLAREIRACAARRRIIDEARRLVAAAYEGGADPDDLVADSTEALAAAGRGDSLARGTEHIGTVVARVLEGITSPKAPSLAVRIPWSSLRRQLHGLAAGKLHVVAGRPAMGKSAFAGSLAWGAAKAGHPVVFVSLEMDRSELGQRFLAGASDVPLDVIARRTQGTPRDFDCLSSGAVALSKAPITITECPGATVGRIRAIVRAELAKFRRAGSTLPPLVVVDYLQLIASERRGAAHREAEVAAVSRELTALAGQTGAAVVALSQLNRGVESRTDKRPLLSDLRESGAIEQDAYSVTLLYRPGYYSSGDAGTDAEAIVAKNRGGRTGIAQLVFESAVCAYRDASDGFEDLDAPESW